VEAAGFNYSRLATHRSLWTTLKVMMGCTRYDVDLGLFVRYKCSQLSVLELVYDAAAELQHANRLTLYWQPKHLASCFCCCSQPHLQRKLLCLVLSADGWTVCAATTAAAAAAR
jgi:hypothetical protein